MALFLVAARQHSLHLISSSGRSTRFKFTQWGRCSSHVSADEGSVRYSGGLLIAVSNSNRVRRISSAGIISSGGRGFKYRGRRCNFHHTLSYPYSAHPHFSPFHSREWWQAAVKQLTIALTCAIIALNAMTNILTIQASARGVPLSSAATIAITGGAYIVFALCLCVLAALPLPFMLNAIHPPPRVVVQTDKGVALALRSNAAATPALKVNPLAGVLLPSWTSDARRQHRTSRHAIGASPQFTSAGTAASHAPAEASSPTHRSSHMTPAHALAFAAPVARPSSSSARVKRVSRMSVVLQSNSDAVASADANDRLGSGGRRGTTRGRHVGRLSDSNLTAPVLTSFAQAATRRQSGLMR